MSAVLGIYYLDGQPLERTNLERMADILAHRGPDGAGIWNRGSLGLGHRMLLTTAESLYERLPLVNRTGNLVLTADARLDNRAELIDALNFTDRLPEQITDGEIILAAYEKWEEQCPEKFLGDFAFAIWDERKQTLFCARDHFGVRSFYYYTSARFFAFASEIKALFCLAEVPRRLNENKVAEYLASIFNESSATFYEGVLRLPPSHSLTIGHEGITIRSYWSLNPSQELHLASNESYTESFRELFIEAVRCRLRSAFPVGSLLSGGLDSSSITCVAQQLLSQNDGGPLPTFSAVFNEVTECDERRFIKPVLAQGSFQPHYVLADQIGPLGDLDSILWHQDEAFYAPNLFMLWKLYSTANKQGIRILLDGFDGDSTVSHGFGYLKELAHARRWLDLAINVRGLAQAHDIPSFWSYAWYYGLSPMISRFRTFNRTRQLWQTELKPLLYRRHKSADYPVWSAPLNPTFVQRIGLRERYRAWQRTQPGMARTEREWHYRAITQDILSFALEVLNRAAAAFFIEPRYPFFDKRLVEFCLALPAEQKLYQGWSRMVLRRAMTDFLPTEVQWRKDKLNFLPNFSRGLQTFERKRLDQLMLNDLELIEDYVDITSLREIYNRFVSSNSRVIPYDVYAIWLVVSLALWLKQTAITP